MGNAKSGQQKQSKQDEQASLGETQIPGYQLLERIGSGANGIVYKARQLSLDRTVAIKVLPQRLSENESFVERFYAEGRAAARLQHPNIVQPIDVGHAGPYHYYVMEFVEGQTASDLLEAEVRLEEQDAARIILDIAKALEYAHNAGLIHRDVKPQNIMLTSDGMAKLADMGLARAVSDNELAEAEKGKAIGSPYYISPEQIRGRSDADFRADIYSLGATFYCLVAGQVPFDAPTAQEVMRRHLLAPLTPPEQHNPAVSRETSQVIQCCMAREREQRYDSTRGLVADMEALTLGEAPLQAQVNLHGDLPVEEETEEEDDDGAAPAPAVAEASSYERPVEQRPPIDSPWFWLAATGWLWAIFFCVLWLTS